MAITTDDVLEVLKPIWQRTPETASRIRGRIESILDFARVKYKINWSVDDGGCNPAQWKGHLDEVLAKRDKSRR